MKKNSSTLTLSIILILVNAIILMYVDVTFIRYFAGIMQVVILPGFLLLEVMFSAKEMNVIWRASLTIPLSLALVTLLLLIIYYFFVYDYRVVIVIISFFNIFLLTIWSYKKQTTTTTNNAIRFPRLPEYRELKNLRLHIFLIASILFFLISVGVACFLPQKSQYFTQFYIITNDSTFPYAFSISPSNSLSVKIGITNNENSASEYQIVFKNGSNMFIISDVIPIGVGENKVMSFEIPMPKNLQTNEVELLLNIEGKPFPYRKLKIFLKSILTDTSQ
jgi:uncharacterized membrane protein